MQVVYVDGSQPERITDPSIFLAGPTPRDANTPSWRPDALDMFWKRGFKGQVYVPERGNWESSFEYYDQVEWEWRNLHGSTVVMFWVPRNMATMPAMTTNVEFGLYLGHRPTVCVYGRPEWGEKNRYLDWLFYKITARHPQTSLETTVEASITHAEKLMKYYEDLKKGGGNP